MGSFRKTGLKEPDQTAGLMLGAPANASRLVTEQNSAPAA
jgi:hypothetical protein